VDSFSLPLSLKVFAMGDENKQGIFKGRNVQNFEKRKNKNSNFGVMVVLAVCFVLITFRGMTK
jgi:hypothetical protein